MNEFVIVLGTMSNHSLSDLEVMCDCGNTID